MKVIILGDTHFGVKQADSFIESYQQKFFDKILFPYIKKHNVQHIIQTGDWFDSRRAIRHSTMQFIRDKIIPKTKGQNWYVLVGNHDMGTKESIYPNACTELLSHYDNFQIISEPTILKINGVEIDCIPWICKENKKQVSDFIRSSTRLLCVGHFELSGFYYYKGIKAEEGHSKKFLDSYAKVWSGHYHTISSSDNIQYVGAPYQLTFGDADDQKGFFVYDTETNETEFVPNTINLFTKIYYDFETFNHKNLKRYKNMHVKLIVKNRGEAAAFDLFLEELLKNSLSLEIIDNFENPEESQLGIDISDTLTIIHNYVDELNEDDNNKTKIKNIISSLYREAVE